MTLGRSSRVKCEGRKVAVANANPAPRFQDSYGFFEHRQRIIDMIHQRMGHDRVKGCVRQVQTPAIAGPKRDPI